MRPNPLLVNEHHLSRGELTIEAKIKGEGSLSISPVQSKRITAALAAAIPMAESDIVHAGRSILEEGAFKRAIAVFILFRVGFTGAQIGQIMNISETSAGQARARVEQRVKSSVPFQRYLDEVLRKFDAKPTR